LRASQTRSLGAQARLVILSFARFAQLTQITEARSLGSKIA
jgi:hypothetical protein